MPMFDMENVQKVESNQNRLMHQELSILCQNF